MLRHQRQISRHVRTQVLGAVPSVVYVLSEFSRRRVRAISFHNDRPRSSSRPRDVTHSSSDGRYPRTTSGYNKRVRTDRLVRCMLSMQVLVAAAVDGIRSRVRALHSVDRSEGRSARVRPLIESG
jgi:hypothetical protein